MNVAAGKKICWCVKVCAFECGCSIIPVQRVWLAELLWDRTAHHNKKKKKRMEAFHAFSLTLFACNIVSLLKKIPHQLRRSILSASEG